MKERSFHVSYKMKRRIIFGISLLIVGLLYTFKNFSFFIRSLSAIGLLISFYLVDHLFQIKFHKRHYFFIIFMALAGFILSPLYFIYPNYDKILHIALPMMFGSIVFYMASKLKLELKWKLVFTFFVILGTVGIFELGEYGLDAMFDLKLQGVFLRDFSGVERLKILQDRIDDTMIDMALGLLAAAIYVWSVYFIEKRKERTEKKKKL